MEEISKKGNNSKMISFYWPCEQISLTRVILAAIQTQKELAEQLKDLPKKMEVI